MLHRACAQVLSVTPSIALVMSWTDFVPDDHVADVIVCRESGRFRSAEEAVAIAGPRCVQRRLCRDRCGLHVERRFVSACVVFYVKA